MSRRSVRPILTAILCVGIAALPACAQGINLRLAPAPSVEQCSAWIQALSERATAQLGWLPYCPNGAAALTAALSGARHESNVAYLVEVVRQSADLRTPDMLAAALALAGDRSATTAGRTAGILVLAGLMGTEQTLGERTLPEMLASPIDAGLCFLRPRVSEGYAVERPLPDDAEVRTARVLERARDDTAADLQVRRLAGCMRRSVLEVAEVPDLTRIEVRYKCGRRLELRNLSPQDIALRYVVRNSAGNVIDEASVRARTAGAWREFRTDLDVTVGTLQLLYEGTVVGTAVMTGAAC